MRHNEVFKVYVDEDIPPKISLVPISEYLISDRICVSGPGNPINAPSVLAFHCHIEISRPYLEISLPYLDFSPPHLAIFTHKLFHIDIPPPILGFFTLIVISIPTFLPHIWPFLP